MVFDRILVDFNRVSSYFNGFQLFLSGGLLPEKNVWAPVLEPRAEQKKRRQGIDEDMMELARFAVAAQQAALREREEQNLVSEAPRLALKSEGFSWIFINFSWIFRGFSTWKLLFERLWQPKGPLRASLEPVSRRCRACTSATWSVRSFDYPAPLGWLGCKGCSGGRCAKIRRLGLETSTATARRSSGSAFRSSTIKCSSRIHSGDAVGVETRMAWLEMRMMI